MKAFEVINWGRIHTANDIDDLFPSTAAGLIRYEQVKLLTWTHVYVHGGQINIVMPESPDLNPTYEMGKGAYALLPPDSWVEGDHRDTKVMMVSRHDYEGMFMLGGPAEQKGRMRYIDGCTDSLIVPPVMKGDPCLNLLHFPAGIDQTIHTHPSVRVGVVASGRGLCRVVQDPKASAAIEEVELLPGTLFIIRPGGIHAFSTPYDEEMRVIAWHPDTDTGPSHEDHPMLNRTIIEGVSAASPDRAEYRTQAVLESGKGS